MVYPKHLCSLPQHTKNVMKISSHICIIWLCTISATVVWTKFGNEMEKDVNKNVIFIFI